MSVTTANTLDPDLIPLGKELKSTRTVKGWSRREMSIKTGFSPSTIEAAERGNPVRREVYIALSKVLNRRIGLVSRDN